MSPHQLIRQAAAGAQINDILARAAQQRRRLPGRQQRPRMLIASARGRRPNLPMSANDRWRSASDVVPLWYHVVMAMNLRLDDEDSALLKALAEAEHVSLHEAALRAIRRSARELAHTDRVREATAEMLDRWGEVLDRLGHA